MLYTERRKDQKTETHRQGTPDRISGIWTWINHYIHYVLWEIYIYILWIYHKTSNIWRTKSDDLNVSRLVLQLSLLYPLKPCVNREWRCSWSSADRRCSSYIWGIINFFAYHRASYIRGLMVCYKAWVLLCLQMFWRGYQRTMLDTRNLATNAFIYASLAIDDFY